MRRVGLAVWCLLAFASVGRTQPSATHFEYMERGYLFNNQPGAKTQEWFEGLLPLHVPLRDRLQAAYDKVLLQPWKAHQTVSAYFSMVVNLRMTRENSAPVRTPSYMPKLTITYFNVKRREQATLPYGVPKSVRLWAVPFIPYGHYSNGQDGCLFTFQREIAGVCTDTTGAPHDLKVNRRDGSFSSHYMQVGVFYRRIFLDSLAPSGNYLPGTSFWSVGGQVRAYQPYYGLGGGMSPELRALYGPTRVRALGNWVTERADGRLFGPGLLRVEGFVEWLGGGRAPQIDPFRVSVEIARTIHDRGGLGVFARAYAGQDDYNLGFLQNLRVIQAGVTTNGEHMPWFHL